MIHHSCPSLRPTPPTRSAKRGILEWISTARKPETRARRV
ncbi:MAG: YdeI/OmpD-associated family protein [Anaerolineales bacterium]